MDNHYERGSGDQGSSPYIPSAVEAARYYLDDTGKIDYARFDPAVLDTLAAGPGFVTEPAQIAPDHLGTTADEFITKSNNFHLLFNDFWGAGRRKEPYYQRFTLLFPGFAGALQAQHQEYTQRCIEIGPSAYQIDGEFVEALRFAYGIMAQLIDLNDIHYENLRVRDIDPTTVLRA